MNSSQHELRVDGARIWTRLAQLARHGETPRGGVERLALTDEHFAARELLMAWGAEFGLSAYTDAIGNLFLRTPATSDEPALLLGSHLDSQPKGGKFDGTYGVVAALEVIETLVRRGVPLRRPIEVVDWTNEEGCRFAPGVMGSACFADPQLIESRLDTRDSAGVSVRDEVSRWHAKYSLPQRPLGRSYAAYLETHIEQGPVLECFSKEIGIVTSIQGIRRYEVTVTGESGHAGTVPRTMRKDSLQSAVRAINYLNSTPAGMAPDIRFTIGRISAEPGSPAVIPGRATFSIDLRHPRQEIIDKMDFVIGRLPTLDFGPCSVEVRETASADPRYFNPDILTLLTRVTEGLGYSFMEITSGAGHDAQSMADMAPSGMIFIPCLGGISHNEAESITAEDAERGGNVLLRASAALASAAG